jgi:hypothetical protein
MMDFLAIVFGGSAVIIALADLVNTLVSTYTSPGRWWPSQMVGRATFVMIRGVARRLPDESNLKERLLSVFGSLVIIELLLVWAILQVFGFGLIWWGLGDIPTITGLADAWYFSGVVFFTVGFGEIVPTEVIPRAGSILEAFFGVVTIALVVGYLPSLYAAYSDRERTLMMLDAGSTERITPTALIKAWAPDADPKKIDAEFVRWEEWAAGILETHSTVPLLGLFRSHDRRQNWVTALGVLSDAALQAQIIVGATDGNGYWFLRRAEAIFSEMTKGADLTPYLRTFDEFQNQSLFADLYDDLGSHGFQLRPFAEAATYVRAARRSWSPAMEYLIDDLECPRGFWSIDSTIESWSANHELEYVSGSD